MIVLDDCKLDKCVMFMTFLVKNAPRNVFFIISALFLGDLRNNA